MYRLSDQQLTDLPSLAQAYSGQAGTPADGTEPGSGDLSQSGGSKPAESSSLPAHDERQSPAGTAARLTKIVDHWHLLVGLVVARQAACIRGADGTQPARQTMPVVQHFFGLQKAPLHLRHSGAFRRVLDGWLPLGLKSCHAQLEQACEVSACLLPACQQ